MVEPLPAEPVDLSDAELTQDFRTLAQEPHLIALPRQPEGTGLHLL